ncbi:uncharacterized protein DS421_2g33630 [Arachis hypogaea]|nr:uncharacterized protein DS421_2g33630 [Arachis hypogaea]
MTPLFSIFPSPVLFLVSLDCHPPSSLRHYSLPSLLLCLSPPPPLALLCPPLLTFYHLLPPFLSLTLSHLLYLLPLSLSTSSQCHPPLSLFLFASPIATYYPLSLFIHCLFDRNFSRTPSCNNFLLDVFNSFSLTRSLNQVLNLMD